MRISLVVVLELLVKFKIILHNVLAHLQSKLLVVKLTIGTTKNLIHCNKEKMKNLATLKHVTKTSILMTQKLSSLVNSNTMMKIPWSSKIIFSIVMMALNTQCSTRQLNLENGKFGNIISTMVSKSQSKKKKVGAQHTNMSILITITII